MGNINLLSIFSIQHLESLAKFWPGEEDVNTILDIVIGWREIALRRSANQYHCGALSLLSMAEWEAFDRICIAEGLKDALKYFDLRIEKAFLESEKAIELDDIVQNLDCEEGEEWKNH
jgi:hypothetical protein